MASFPIATVWYLTNGYGHSWIVCYTTQEILDAVAESHPDFSVKVQYWGGKK